MQCSNCLAVKMKIFIDIFDIFAQNIDCGFTLEPPRVEPPLSHNLCFGSKIIVYPCITI